MAASIWDWSSTAADNDDADTGINWAEGQNPSTVNDSARTVMKRLADLLLDLGYTNATGGTASAVTLTTDANFGALATGRLITFKNTNASTGATTLNVNSIGAKKLLKFTASGEAELAANDTIANGYYAAIYDAAADGGTGAWILLNGHVFMPRAGGTFTGAVLHASGSASAPSIGFSADSNTGFYHDGTADTITIAAGGAKVGALDATGLTYSVAGGGQVDILLQGEGSAFGLIQRSSADASGPSFGFRKSRGTIASPGLVVQNDIGGEFSFSYWTSGSTFATTCGLRASVIAATPSATDMETRLTILLAAASSITRTEIARLDHATGLSMFGANPVIDQNRSIRLRSYTQATVPSAATAGLLIYCSDDLAGAQPYFSDGTNWRRITDRSVVP